MRFASRYSPYFVNLCEQGSMASIASIARIKDISHLSRCEIDTLRTTGKLRFSELEQFGVGRLFWQR